MVEPDFSFNSDQATLAIDEVRILPMSHKYDPSKVHVGLMIYSVDGQRDFILNDAMLRIKSGDLLIHQIHHALTGSPDVYRDLIRTIFGTHRVNLIGLVFTFSGDGRFTDCMRWNPSSYSHVSPMHPTEQKLLEIVLVTFYMNHAWLSMPVAKHIDVESLSQTAKKQYLMKLAEIEQAFLKRRDEQKQNHLPLSNLLRLHSHSLHHHSDSFRSFEWTPTRAQQFDETIQALLDGFYSTIQDTFPDGEFDRDQYIYINDNTKQLMANLAQPYGQLPSVATPPMIYSQLPRNYF